MRSYRRAGNAAEENSFQARLANILLQDLGYENATEMCRQKGWRHALASLQSNSNQLFQDKC